MKAKYNECYFDKRYSSPDSIALSYLRTKSSELGISPDLENVRIKKTRQTAGGRYVYFEQYVNNIPVFSTTGVIALNKEDTVTYVLNNFRKINKNEINAKAGITGKDAVNMATEYLNINKTIARSPKTELVFFESIDKGMELAWKVNIVAMEPIGDWFVVINANDGRIIHVEDIAEYYNGSGMVFNPNPITSAQTVYGGDYVDNYDLNNTALQDQLIQVTLRDITYENGVYRLEGPYCVLDDVETPWDNFPRLANPNDFNYTRNQQGFEAVMVYYHIDLASRRIESLGYNEPGLKTFSADPHGLNGADLSHYSTSHNYVAFGEGGVDDAEDADIIWHEFAHALQWNLGTGYMSSTGETQSVKEGSSDYWAVSYSRSVSPYNWGLWANWDGHNPFWAGRRADLDWVYPDDYVSGHDGGQIWSSALMKIWGDLGRDITDKLFLETHFLWGSSPTMEDAAEAFIQADIQLYNGSHYCTIVNHFRTHGLTDRLLTPSTTQFDIRNVDSYGNYLYEDITNQLIANDYAYQDIAEWEWDYGGWYHWEVTSTKYISFVDVPSFSYRDISVRAKNECGASNWYTERFYPYEGYFLVFSPNPSTGETVLSIESASTEKTFDETTEWELEVYSETQLLKERKTRLKGKNTTIQTYGWQDGIYLVRVKYNEEVLTGKLVVKKM